MSDIADMLCWRFPDLLSKTLQRDLAHIEELRNWFSDGICSQIEYSLTAHLSDTKREKQWNSLLNNSKLMIESPTMFYIAPHIAATCATA